MPFYPRAVREKKTVACTQSEHEGSHTELNGTEKDSAITPSRSSPGGKADSAGEPCARRRPLARPRSPAPPGASAELVTRGSAKGQAGPRGHIHSRLFPLPGSRSPARPPAARPHRDSRPMLTARESGARRTTRRRTGPRHRPRYALLPRREAALSGGSGHSGGSHPRAANENRTSWRRRQKEGRGASEAASSS